MRRRPRLLLAAAVLAAAGLAAACSSLGFYAQGVRGGLEILLSREPIEKLLAEPATPAELAERLRLALAVRSFAVGELALPDNGSYTHYSALGRPYALWNVVAAPELGLEPVTWCFPFAGCVSYRGYFQERRASRFAGRLEARGFDTVVEGVTTYSTLGWFRDPVLDTFLDLPAPELAGVIVHELAHQRLYVADDTTFNESFASAVEQLGVERWLGSQGLAAELPAYQARQERQEARLARLLAARDALAAVYQSPRPDEEKRQAKAELLAALRRELELPADWDLDNARLASIGAYTALVPAFVELFAREGQDFPRFYAAAEKLGRLPAESRSVALRRLVQQPPEL